VVSGGRKFNFLKDFGTKRISDSRCARCPQRLDLFVSEEGTERAESSITSECIGLH